MKKKDGLSSMFKTAKKNVLKCTNWLGYHFIYKANIMPLVMMHVDGGLSSQIIRISVGKLFEEAGFRVKYELDYYKQNGKNKLAFPYRISTCFPSVIVPEANRWEVLRYKLFYDAEKSHVKNSVDINSWDHKRALYLSGYSTDYLIDKTRISSFFNIHEIEKQLSCEAWKWANEIEKCRKHNIITVGVHVRRGDMTQAGGYWKVLNSKYFIAAINMIPNRDQCKFFFFSNGFDFVTNEIIPNLDIDYSLVQGTTCDYEDFYLLSRCNTQIGSQGSWGTIAYLFNEDNNKRLITYNREGALGFDHSERGVTVIELDNSMFLNSCNN